MSKMLYKGPVTNMMPLAHKSPRYQDCISATVLNGAEVTFKILSSISFSVSSQ